MCLSEPQSVHIVATTLKSYLSTIYIEDSVVVERDTNRAVAGKAGQPAYQGWIPRGEDKADSEGVRARVRRVERLAGSRVFDSQVSEALLRSFSLLVKPHNQL